MTKESQHSGTIFVDYLCNQKFLESRRGKKIIGEHMLLGWLANQDLNLEETLSHMAKSEFKRQWHLNQCYLDLLQELAPEFQKVEIAPTLLKGSALLGELYPELGTRSMSDIDMLINKEELPAVIKLLKDNGFEPHGHQKWKANAHKVELIRIKNGIELVVELHTSLFYHCENPDWETESFTRDPYLILKKEHLFLFQCTHLGFQHSFLKLFWVLDIHYLLIQSKGLDESAVLIMAKKYKVYNSLVFTLHILNKFFSTPMGEPFKAAIAKVSPVKKRIFSQDFLIEPKKSMSHYLLVKHLCKGSFKENLAYNLGWLKDKLS